MTMVFSLRANQRLIIFYAVIGQEEFQESHPIPVV